jgi:hypothetical protein
MSKHKKKLYIGFSIILLFFVFFLLPSLEKENQISHSPTSPILKDKNTESATILAGDMVAHLLFSPGILLYDALKQEKDTGLMPFSGKNYSGLGFFLTDIGSLHSVPGKNLLYYINGKEATVGISSYTLKDGDIVEWKLE